MIKKLFAAITLGALCFSSTAADVSWPSRPIKIIVPFAAGGATDRTARLLATQLNESLGQPVIVENRAGGGGNIGATAAAQAAPDGYTVVLSYVGTFAINPHIHKEALPFDPIKDFAPVTPVAEALRVMAVNSAVPANNVQEFIDYAKNSGTDIFCGSSGVGGADYIACTEFNRIASTNVKAVPYKGGAPAMVDLVAGRTQLQFATLPGALPHIQSGAIKPLAILTENRFPLLPDVPTLKESGISNFDINNWYGISAPAGTPEPIIQKLNQHLVMALKTPEIQKQFANLGLVPMWSTPAEFAEFIAKDSARWKAMVERTPAP